MGFDRHRLPTLKLEECITSIESSCRTTPALPLYTRNGLLSVGSSCATKRCAVHHDTQYAWDTTHPTYVSWGTFPSRRAEPPFNRIAYTWRIHSGALSTVKCCSRKEAPLACDAICWICCRPWVQTLDSTIAVSVTHQAILPGCRNPLSSIL